MNNIRRFAALLLGLMLAISLSAASAQQMPMHSRQAEVLGSGKSIESTVAVSINTPVVSSLASSFLGGEEGAAQLTAILDGINKLKFSALSTMENAHVSFGTDAAEIANADVSVNMETGENTIIASFLPGYALSVDADAIKQLLAGSLKFQQQPETLAKIGEKYAGVLSDAFSAEILAGLKSEEGAFTVEGAEYDRHVSGDVTPAMAAKFVKAIIAVAQQDAELKPLLDAALASNTQENAPKTADELFAAAVKGLDETIERNAADDPLKVDVYQNSKTKAMSIVGANVKTSATRIGLTLLPGENGIDLNLKVLTKTLGSDETAESFDWAKAEQNAAAGDPSITQVSVAVSGKKDEAANKSTFSAAYNINVMGMPVAITVTGDETLTGAYESSFAFSLAAMSPEPLLTLSGKAVESDRKPEPAKPDGLQVVELKQDASAEDLAPLEQILQEKGLPMLMENFSKALPEESGLVMQLLQGATQGGATQTN